MNTLRLFALLLACWGGLVWAQDAGGERSCLDCHIAISDVAVHAINNTVHGSLGGGGDAACIACHGNSSEHRSQPTNAAPEVSFGPRWRSDHDARNGACLDCHESGAVLHWVGSTHAVEGLACDTCHDSHAQADLATVRGEDEACLTCHGEVRAQLALPSRHPIAEGKTACGDCHNPHGGLGDGDLLQVSLNDNCFSCHQEKRGPFLWEHPPVAEDCSLCHRPHGSVHERLLIARGPAQCQQCHAAAFHPSVPYGSEGLPGGSANQNLLGKNCLNCHGQVHGSNHPSGARLTR